jgi:hypothetical protein
VTSGQDLFASFDEASRSDPSLGFVAETSIPRIVVEREGVDFANKNAAF